MMLHDLVVEFESLGDHRTGTAVDVHMRAWFSDQLAARGCRVSEAPYAFRRFDADASVTVDGYEVESMPLWYSWTGEVNDVARVVRTELTGNWAMSGPDETRTAETGPVAVATVGAIDAVITPNRAPSSPAGPPIMLVAPSSVAFGSASLSPAGVRIRGHAAVVDGSSANVIGWRGGASETPIVLTTPLSGWFGCAAERGTGIAVLLHLLDRLPDDTSILVLGTTGHELEHVGVQEWLAGPGATAVPRAIVHLGASVAACEATAAGPELSARRFALLRLGSAVDRDRIIASLDDARFSVAYEPSDWLGEGRQWSTLGVPLLSFVGTFSRFHTAHDRAFLSTDPTLLALVADRISTATTEFLRV